MKTRLFFTRNVTFYRKVDPTRGLFWKPYFHTSLFNTMWGLLWKNEMWDLGKCELCEVCVVCVVPHYHPLSVSCELWVVSCVSCEFVYIYNIYIYIYIYIGVSLWVVWGVSCVRCSPLSPTFCELWVVSCELCELWVCELWVICCVSCVSCYVSCLPRTCRYYTCIYIIYIDTFYRD